MTCLSYFWPRFAALSLLVILALIVPSFANEPPTDNDTDDPVIVIRLDEVVNLRANALGLKLDRLVKNRSDRNGHGCSLPSAIEAMASIQGITSLDGFTVHRAKTYGAMIASEAVATAKDYACGKLGADRAQVPNLVDLVDYDAAVAHVEKGFPVVISDTGGEGSPYGKHRIHHAVVLLSSVQINGHKNYVIADLNFVGKKDCFQLLRPAELRRRMGSRDYTLAIAILPRN